MPLNQVQLHLGESLPVKDVKNPLRFTASDVLLDQLPVSRVTFELDKLNGLRSLAYEFSMDDMRGTGWSSGTARTASQHDHGDQESLPTDLGLEHRRRSDHSSKTQQFRAPAVSDLISTKQA